MWVLKFKSEMVIVLLYVKSLFIKMSVVEDLNEEWWYLYFSVFFYMVFIREIFDEGFRKIGRFVEEFMELG